MVGTAGAGASAVDGPALAALEIGLSERFLQSLLGGLAGYLEYDGAAPVGRPIWHIAPRPDEVLQAQEMLARFAATTRSGAQVERHLGSGTGGPVGEAARCRDGAHGRRERDRGRPRAAVAGH